MLPSLSSSSSASSTTTTNAILSQLLGFTKYVGQHHIPIVESTVAWTTVAVFTIRYVVDYIRLCRSMAALRKHPEQWWSHYPTRLPLCALAQTRAELEVPLLERWTRLRMAVLLALAATKEAGICHSKTKTTELDPLLSNQELQDWSDHDWIQMVHSSLDVRRELSYLMRILARKLKDDDCIGTITTATSNGSTTLATTTTADPDNHGDNEAICWRVVNTLQRLWPQFLEFPECIRHPIVHASAPFRIAVIVPMYKESFETIQKTLQHAWAHCHDSPQYIQIIIVCADDTAPTTQRDEESCPHASLKEQLLQHISSQSPTTSETKSATTWGDLHVIGLPTNSSCTTTNTTTTNGGGRGRTLNAGIPHANAPILTFLHADTLVPSGWDIQIQQALLLSPPDPTTPLSPKSDRTVFPQACAFTMGIDMNLWTWWNTPGLLFAQWQGILRCHCGLPYGDSVLSFTKSTLEYIGGYPEQPLMEDYEIMDWLRVRSKVLGDDASRNKYPTERLILLKDQAKCSPRRWQKFGVAYTSLINAICIHRYRQQGVPAEELFDFYYHSPKKSTNETT